MATDLEIIEENLDDNTEYKELNCFRIVASYRDFLLGIIYSIDSFKGKTKIEGYKTRLHPYEEETDRYYIIKPENIRKVIPKLEFFLIPLITIYNDFYTKKTIKLTKIDKFYIRKYLAFLHLAIDSKGYKMEK